MRLDRAIKSLTNLHQRMAQAAEENPESRFFGLRIFDVGALAMVVQMLKVEAEQRIAHGQSLHVDLHDKAYARLQGIQKSMKEAV